MTLRKILESIGVEVEQAENGLERIEVAREREELDAMKIVMCTPRTEVSQETLALLSRAKEYVMKPFTTDVIRGRVERCGRPVLAS